MEDVNFKAARKYLEYRAARKGDMEIIDEEGMAYLDENGDVHIPVVSDVDVEWDATYEEKRRIRREWEALMDQFMGENPEYADCQVVADLIIVTIKGTNRALIKHVINYQWR